MVDVRGKRVYLSGPMTGLPDYGRDAFEDAHNAIAAKGAGIVYSPAYLPDGYTHEEYMAHSIAVLVTREHCFIGAPMYYDLLVSLTGWEGSEDARLERAVAEACGIECRDLSEVVG